MDFRQGVLLEPLNPNRKNSNSENTKGESTERLTLQKPEQAKLERWINELNKKFEGMIKLTKSDLANFLIRHHAEILSDDEIIKIESEHFDEIRWMNWALNRIRAAKKEGQSLTLNDLMTKRQQQPGQALKTPKRKRSSPNANDKHSAPATLSIATEPATSEDLKGS